VLNDANLQVVDLIYYLYLVGFIWTINKFSTNQGVVGSIPASRTKRHGSAPSVLTLFFVHVVSAWIRVKNALQGTDGVHRLPFPATHMKDPHEHPIPGYCLRPCGMRRVCQYR
jgi:hypothetical protein